jgi:hypothetical protein
VSRYISTARRAVAGHVVVSFVDDLLQRRTLAVPFALSDGETLQELITHAAENLPLRPPHLDETGD